MSQYEILIQRINQLTLLVNDIKGNSKTTTEFNRQNILDPTFSVRVFKDGVSEYVKLSQILGSSSGGTGGVVSFTVTTLDSVIDQNAYTFPSGLNIVSVIIGYTEIFAYTYNSTTGLLTINDTNLLPFIENGIKIRIRSSDSSNFTIKPNIVIETVNNQDTYAIGTGKNIIGVFVGYTEVFDFTYNSNTGNLTINDQNLLPLSGGLQITIKNY